MLYYTVYMKNLNNGSGYIDIALEDEQLLKDYVQFLEVGIRSQRSYSVAEHGKSGSQRGRFVVNLTDIAALTVAQAHGSSKAVERLAVPSPSSP
jgi:hypothetical protein